MKDHLADYLGRLTGALERIDHKDVDAIGEALHRAYCGGRQVFVIGNGGSASTASHMAADMGKNTIGPGMERFRIQSLNDNIPMLTALANDIGYDHVFSEQLENLIQPGDALIAISGSGNSPNVLRALEYARGRSALLVGLLGMDGGKARDLCDLALIVDSQDYGVIEDAHLILNHVLVEYFQAKLAAERPWLR